MPTAHAFHFIDVFADAPLEGNSLAVVENADDLSDETLRGIAREFNQSETTFLLEPTRAGSTIRLRSLTATGAEVFGAGHNALGAWLWLLQSRPELAEATGLAQEIGDEVLPVSVSRTSAGRILVSMAQSAPVFGQHATDIPALADALGLQSGQLAGDAQVVSTGAGHLLVPVTNRAAVDAVSPQAGPLAEALALVGGEGCYVFSTDPIDAAAAAYARFFNPTMGISEDPATGTAAGPLAALLVERGIRPDGAAMVIEQGYRMGRASRIRVTVDGAAVSISGSGVVVADGTLRL